MPSSAFEEGFGLQTPLVTGQLKTLRYSSYFHTALKLFKEQLRRGFFAASGRRETLTPVALDKLSVATELEDVYSLLQQDAFVILPCQSRGSSGSEYEGTRLTLVQMPHEGFDFTIRTPSTPVRWEQFDGEMRANFASMMHLLIEVSSGGGGGSDSPPPQLLHCCLEVFYFWVVFAPLSRGTAICGYEMMSALALACGWRFSRQLPVGKQLDWEAIFSPTVEAFKNNVGGWFEGSLQRCNSLVEAQADLNSICTLRAMILALTKAEPPIPGGGTG